MSEVVVSAVTLTGNKHKRRGVPCEDFSLAVQRDGVSCVVVADGAGSKQYTHAKLGSKSACETVSELLLSYFDELYYENREAAVRSLVIAAVHVGFANIIEKLKLDSLERLSCTLLFCAVKDRRVLIGHIGDGLIAAISSSGIHPITMPQNDPAGHTYFVTAPHASDYMRLIKTTTDDLHGIALMTDGVQDSVYDENSGLVKPVVGRMIQTCEKGAEQSAEDIKNILSQYIVGASNNSDDSSFGILYFKDTAGPDIDSLPKKAEAFGKSSESFKELQNLMLPEVKKAKTIITEAASNPEPSGVPMDDDDYDDISGDSVKAVPSKTTKKETENSADKEDKIPAEDPLKDNSSKSAHTSSILKLVALLELIAIIALLIKMFIIG